MYVTRTRAHRPFPVDQSLRIYFQIVPHSTFQPTNAVLLGRGKRWARGGPVSLRNTLRHSNLLENIVVWTFL